MKKIYLLFIALFAGWMAINAADVTQGALLYNVTKVGSTNYLLIAGVNPSSSADINIVFGKMTYYNSTTQQTETGFCIGIGSSISFSGNSRVKSIRSTSDVTSVNSIPAWCFQNCTNLEMVDLSTINHLPFEIGHYAFSGCTRLATVKLPAAMGAIGTHAFNNCPFTNIQINSIDRIEPYAFAGCSNLRKVTWANTRELTEYSGAATFDANTQVSMTPFYAVKDQITSVVLFGNYSRSVFKGMTNLASVSCVPDITVIGGGAFIGCTSLASVSGMQNVRVYEDKCFFNCRLMKEEIIIKPAIGGEIYIGDSAFIGSGVTKLVIGTEDSEGSSFELREGAFSYCTALSEVELHGKVKDEYENTFRGCAGVKKLYWGCSLYFYKADVETYVEKGSFLSKFINLEELTINRSSSIYKHEFYNLKKLKKVTIGSRVYSVAENAFYGCEAVTSLYWNVALNRNKYSSADKSPFAQAKLEYVKFGRDVVHIPAYLLAGQSSLHSFVTESRGVNTLEPIQTIGSHAFEGLDKLRNITFSESVQSIGPEAFKGCSSITWIRSEAATPPTLANDVFAGCNNGNLRTLDLTVPSGSESQYMAAEGWCEFYGTCGGDEAVEEVQGDMVQCTKVIENGQLYILRDGKVFNLQGAQVK